MKYPLTITMPAMSPTMTNGQISKWYKSSGDSIEKGDVFADIETDKAIVELESEHDGIVDQILVPAGINVIVGAPIAIILTATKQIADNELTSIPSIADDYSNSIDLSNANFINNAKSETMWKHLRNEGIFVSPAAKALIEDNSLNPSKILGTGLGGRITLNDAMTALQSSLESTIENIEPITLSTGATTNIAKQSSWLTSWHSNVISNKKSASQMRITIAERLSRASAEIPHFYLELDVDITELIKLRLQINALSPLSSKISINDFITKAAATSLDKNPNLNVQFCPPDSIMEFTNVDICIAVSTPSGLITPIITDANKKDLRQIAIETKELVQRARSRNLRPEEYEGGNITISNLGMYGIKRFLPIINPPQPFILAIGAADVYKDERSKISITMAADHRIIDGAEAAAFLKELKDLLENPLALLI